MMLTHINELLLKLSKRPGIDEYFLMEALVVSSRGTCSRRKVGCVLVDKYDRILSTGHNGVPKGLQHCIDHPCPGSSMSTGQGLSDCEAIHAEQNAIGSCQARSSVRKAYCTTSPCVNCIKLLLTTPCEEIVFLDEYPHSQSKELWQRSKRKWRKYEKQDNIIQES